MPGTVLKQILYSRLSEMARLLHVSLISLFSDDQACAEFEPCLNYQKCTTSVKFSHASAHYSPPSNRVQLRSVHATHDFACACPSGFAGANSSLTCDLEINMCYSNPCTPNSACLSVESGFRCVCDAGFTGRLCEFNLKQDKCCNTNNKNSQVSFSSTTTAKPNQMANSTNSLTTTLEPHFQHYLLLNTDFNQTRCIGEQKAKKFKSSGNMIVGSVCKGTSVCKNLILGGSVCDECAGNSTYYNRFCELRGRHFPTSKSGHAYIAVAGLTRNRFRFKLKLTFATVQSNGVLLFNGRTDSNGDFISLAIRNDILTFSFSLGGSATVRQMHIDALSVTDGRWRTVTIEYAHRNVTLSVDNDKLPEVDACELANSASSENCLRVRKSFELPEKCRSQIETCHRFLDLNGPLVLGKQQLSDSGAVSGFSGCMMDMYVDERLVDLDVSGEDVLAESGTEPGCEPKANVCRSRSGALREQLSKCRHIWLDAFEYECRRDSNGVFVSQARGSDSVVGKCVSSDGEVLGLGGNGYIALPERQIGNSSNFFFFGFNNSHIIMWQQKIDLNAKKYTLNDKM